MKWFDVDKVGLGKLVERKGKAFILHELIQNAWDENTTSVTITLEAIPGKSLAKLTIEDDSPDGFADLRHAYTLFSESKKKSDATKRGRFNLGEKLVLSLCEEAEIISTTGGVRFDNTGRHPLRLRREAGTRIEAIIKLSRAELKEVLDSVEQLRPPQNVTTTINGKVLNSESPIAIVEVSLPTELSDEEGYIRRCTRKTQVRIHNPIRSVGWIYEMGIPIVETGDRFDVDIAQRVPLSLDRDNVSPKYLQAVRTVVLNATAHLLTKEESAAGWVTSAASSDEVDIKALRKVIEDRFDKDPVSYDPSDPEANNVAASHGRRPISGGAMPGEMWQQVKKHQLVTPAGKAFPTPKPYDLRGPQETVIPEKDWTPAMRRVAIFSQWAARVALKKDIEIKFSHAGETFAACYGECELTFNVESLGESWFDGPRAEIVDLIIHELGHHFEKNHLSAGYYKGLTKIAGELFVNAKNAPPWCDD